MTRTTRTVTKTVRSTAPAELSVEDVHNKASLNALESIAASLAVIAKVVQTKLGTGTNTRAPAPVAAPVAAAPAPSPVAAPAAPTRKVRRSTPKAEPATLTRELLVELLAANGNSAAAVARITRRNVDTVRNAMRSFGLPLNGPGRVPRAAKAPVTFPALASSTPTSTPPASARRARGTAAPLDAAALPLSSEAQEILRRVNTLIQAQVSEAPKSVTSSKAPKAPKASKSPPEPSQASK